MLTSYEREVCERLAEIEDEDADRCANCGGEDCICCEYYHDRQKWIDPEELFQNEDIFSGWHDDDYDEEETK